MERPLPAIHVQKADVPNKMKNYIRDLLFIILISLIISISNAELILASDKARILLNERVVSVDSSGRMSTVIHRIVKTGEVTENRKVNDVGISYDSSVDTVNWLWARRGKDAASVNSESGVDLIGIVPPFAYGESDGLVDIVVRIPLEGNGDVADYAYKIERTRPPMGAHFWSMHIFTDEVPVEKAIFQVEIPKGRRIYFVQQGVPNDPVVDESDKTITYIWEMNSLASNDGSNGSIAYVVVTSTPDWEGLFPWFNAMYSRGLVTDKTLNDYANEVYAAYRNNKFEMVKQFYKKTATGVVPELLSFPRRALPPHSAKDVNLRGSGDCKDKVVLLTALLRHVHIKAYPALLNMEYTGNLEANLPHPYHFNHAIVYIPKQTGLDVDLWLDPTIHSPEWFSVGPDIKGRDALVLMDEKTRFLRIPD
jgi:hypothetical protein